ncbi:MAG: metallophosphoesterase [Rhodospirillales bacterium]|nr:metallophosphoesterase [Rhodospirillales bacterium]
MLMDMKPDAKLKPCAPAQSRLYAIGDVHGRLDLLDDLLGQIAQDATPPTTPKRRVLVLLGDLIDRGPDSKGVLDRMVQLTQDQRLWGQLFNTTLLPGFEIHILKGNHEDSMLRFLADDSEGEQWRANGGNEALKSYGLDPLQSPQALRAALLNALPKTHRRLLRGLKLAHVEGDYAFVHAGVKPGIPWTEQSENDLLWIRADFTKSEANFGYCVVHGHSPVDVPEVRSNRIGIDTRAWASGVLTCLVLEDDTQRFLNT